ncbi:unnamed protein product [Owenia fusiformis]|uniref:Uncharacterized protein n=1 Tax=Owenia fusiformis TaxID=6347 RepID=A0A8J1UIV9_OWEFU|nr:unnamed protein product [Owenia fusiformis]
MPASTAVPIFEVLRSKPKGLPEVGQQFNTVHQETHDVSETPYRLPKMQSKTRKPKQQMHSLWSKHEFNRQTHGDFQIRPSHLMMPPRTVAKYYQLGVYNPVMHIAGIVPVDKDESTLVAHDDDQAFYKKQKAPYGPYEYAVNTEARRDEIYGGPSPSPILRERSPRNSIHWGLGLGIKQEFDIQGASGRQGPFSREFQTKCPTPANWLRMKYNNRSKTIWW